MYKLLIFVINKGFEILKVTHKIQLTKAIVNILEHSTFVDFPIVDFLKKHNFPEVAEILEILN